MAVHYPTRCCEIHRVVALLLCFSPLLPPPIVAAQESMGQSMPEAAEHAQATGQPTVPLSRRQPPTSVDPALAEHVARSAAQIDRLVEEQLKAHKSRPNPPTNDMQFVRRIYLDIAGTIPSTGKPRSF